LNRLQKFSSCTFLEHRQPVKWITSSAGLSSKFDCSSTVLLTTPETIALALLEHDISMIHFLYWTYPALKLGYAVYPIINDFSDSGNFYAKTDFAYLYPVI
jgi:hypothetical protein